MFIVQLKFARVENGKLVLHDCEYAKPQRACKRGKKRQSKSLFVHLSRKKIRRNEIRQNEMTPLE